MTQYRAAKKLDALDARMDALEQERSALADSPPDAGQRERLEHLAAEIRELRPRQQAAAVEYWSTVVSETRAKLEDLRSESPTSAWRRGIWWDVLTILWILAGAGWLYRKIPGAAVGTVVTAAIAPFLFANRKRQRVESIRKGEEKLREAEQQLAQAQRETQAGQG